MLSESASSVFYALLSSLIFAFSSVLVKIGTKHTSSLAALWLTLTINVLVLGTWALFKVDFHNFSLWDWRHFIVAGVFAPLLGRFFQFLGMAHLGANITTPLTLTHPLITILLALLFMGEETTFLGLLGAFLVLVGSIAVGLQGSSVPNTFYKTGKISIYLLYPFAAAFSYGLSVALRKAGITSSTDLIVATAITITTSWTIASLFILPKKLDTFIPFDPNDLAILIIAGFLYSFGPLLLLIALEKGNLIVVAPLTATTPLFSLIITYLLIRKEEIFNRWIVFGTCSSFAGICLSITFGTI